MTDTLFDPLPAAAILIDAAQSGALLTALPAASRPQDLGNGYDVQDAVMTQMGVQRAGWKLGVGSPAQLRATGLDRPLIGQLQASRCHEDGATLRMPSDDPITIECEIAFILDRDIPPTLGRMPTSADVRHTCVTFEVVRSRFTDRRVVGWPSFAADNVGFEALIVSQPFCTGLELEAIRRVNDSAVVMLDGETKARALSGDAATDPLRSLTVLFEHAAERGITLKAGEIISTGAMCQPFDIPGRQHTIRLSYEGCELTASLI